MRVLQNFWLLLTLFVSTTCAVPIFDSLLGNSVNKYILVFETGNVTPAERVQQVRNKIIDIGGKITFDYSLTITGFSFTLDKNEKVATLDTLNNAKWPFFIEKDSPTKIR